MMLSTNNKIWKIFENLKVLDGQDNEGEDVISDADDDAEGDGDYDAEGDAEGDPEGDNFIDPNDLDDKQKALLKKEGYELVEDEGEASEKDAKEEEDDKPKAGKRQREDEGDEKGNNKRQKTEE